MTEVYIVCQCWDYEGCRFLAVFSTEELAVEYIRKEVEKYYWNTSQDYEITKAVLDDGS